MGSNPTACVKKRGELNVEKDTNQATSEQITEYELDETNAILTESKQNLLNLQ